MFQYHNMLVLKLKRNALLNNITQAKSSRKIFFYSILRTSVTYVHRYIHIYMQLCFRVKIRTTAPTLQSKALTALRHFHTSIYVAHSFLLQYAPFPYTHVFSYTLMHTQYPLQRTRLVSSPSLSNQQFATLAPMIHRSPVLVEMGSSPQGAVLCVDVNHRHNMMSTQGS